ncbi:MAG TPA: NAD-dependent epimerase/dehydratase family protein [Gemmatimonadales bacterium]|nr:NAD-dependent epimerase/dehydratase family protein [Gemmatimonadales bacterium]
MILLTGATGLVGRQVAELLGARGTPITAMVRDEARASWLTGLGARLVTDPITSADTWHAVREVTAIVHCAAIIAGGRSWESYAAANIRTTELAARRARELGVPLVQVSSVAVYGGSTTEPVGTVGEEFPFRPLADGAWYARSKRESEAAVWREAERGLQAIALRPCVIYGPHDRLFLPKLVRQARRGWMPLIGAGDRPMALVHARSVGEAVLAALDSKTGWGRPYNVTGDAPIAPRDVVAALGRGIGRRVRTPRLPEGATLTLARGLDSVAGLMMPKGLFPGSLTTAVGYWRGGDPYRSDAIRRELGWRPILDHGIEIERAARNV